MNQDIDLQAQQEGESDRAYLAYTTYRDMPPPRYELGAYTAYVNSLSGARHTGSGKVRGVSKTYKGWMSEFNWSARVKDWDNKKSQRIQSAQLEADRQGYIQRIEDSRALLERTATIGMKSAELQLAFNFKQMQLLAKEAGNRIATRDEMAQLVSIARVTRDSIDGLGSAKTEIYDALGLVQTIEQLTAVNAEG
jgi:hypothetical protein